MIYRHSLLVLATVLFLSFAPHALASDGEEFKLPSISGYSPVSYFTEGVPQLGDPKFAVENRGRVYYLTSAEQVEIYNANPDKYRPLHDVCPYSLALGKVKPLDPNHFKIVDDKLLLFHVNDDKNALFEWNNSTLSEEELLRRAEGNQILVKF